jgi:putative transposase
MNTLFRAVGNSKQSFHQYHNRLILKLEEEEYLRYMISEIRANHPTMGIRDLYFKIGPQTMGRDIFEDFCREEGFVVKAKRSYRRTTNSNGVKRFDNLTLTIELTAPDQLWVSDITYFEVGDSFSYLTFILDVFTRKILGYSVSISLRTTATTLPALKMAISARGKQRFENLILHSDGGGQYYADDFLKLTKDTCITNSMCKYPWENPYAERINGTIKNNYLIHWHIKDFKQLNKEVDRAVKLYNSDKPHKSLKRLTPDEFENNYFSTGKQSDGDKSATENKSQKPGGIKTLRVDGNQSDEVYSSSVKYQTSVKFHGKQSSGSNVAMEYKSKIQR